MCSSVDSPGSASLWDRKIVRAPLRIGNVCRVGRRVSNERSQQAKQQCSVKSCVFADKRGSYSSPIVEAESARSSRQASIVAESQGRAFVSGIDNDVAVETGVAVAPMVTRCCVHALRTWCLASRESGGMAISFLSHVSSWTGFCLHPVFCCVLQRCFLAENK